MASEATRQKRLVKSGFLGTVGSDKNYVQRQISFDALEEILLKYGELFARGFAGELDKQDKNASGAGVDSIRYEFEKLGSLFEVKIYMADYLKFVDQGVQGIDPARSKEKTSPFKFKFVNPSKKHVEALEKWLKDKNVTAIITVPKGITSKLLKPEDLAFVIGRSIKIHGLKATYFKQKTVENLIEDFKKEIATAISEDLTVNILF